MDRCKYCGGDGKHPTDCPAFVEAEKTSVDFHDLDLLSEALASDDPALKKAAGDFLRTEMDYSDDEIEAAAANQRQRREVHAAMREELRSRLENDPVPTPEELSMGAFAEQIEPQVRDAVRVLRRKGYNTVSSGFADTDQQCLTFDRLDPAELGEGTVQRLKALGFQPSKKSIWFSVPEANLEAMKATWDELAEILPDRGRPAPDAPHPQAEHFRNKYGRTI